MKITKMENVGVGTELAKRFYLDDVVLKKTCTCGEEMTVDLGHYCLDYPVVGRDINVYMYCDECGTDYDEAMTVRVDINLTIKES